MSEGVCTSPNWNHRLMIPARGRWIQRDTKCRTSVAAPRPRNRGLRSGPTRGTGRARPEHRRSGLGRPGNSAQTVMNPNSLAPVLRLDRQEFPARPGVSLAPHQRALHGPHAQATCPSRLDTCERVLPVDIGLTHGPVQGERFFWQIIAKRSQKNALAMIISTSSRAAASSRCTEPS